MKKQLLKDFRGLVTSPGILMRAEASCTQADNVVIDAPGVIRKRRGFSRQPGGTGGPAWSVLTSRAMGSNALVHYGTSATATALRYGDGSGALTAVTAIDSSSVTRSPDERMHMAQCQRSHYLTSDEGVRRWESDLGSLRYAGMPYGMCYAYSLTAGTLLATSRAVAYRVTWHRKDPDGVELGGPPTERAVARNITGMTGYGGVASDVQMRIPLPTEFGTTATALTTSYYYRLWRTLTFDTAYADPDDEMFLVHEAYITAGDLAAGFANVTDSTPDAYLTGGAKLHTNFYNFPAGEEGLTQGQLNADDMPPRATDVAYWQDCAWYANIDMRPSFVFTFIKSFTDGDTYTIGGVTYTARNAPGAATEFRIDAGFASASIDWERTAANFCYTVNTYASSTVWAFYISQSGQLPATVLLVDRDFGGFSAASSVGKQRPDLTTTRTADDASAANVLAYSKPGRADAVPQQNRLMCGPADARILRIQPFREWLLVFTDYGIYRVTGQTFADFAVTPFDLTYRLMCPESVAVCDDRVYAWCYEGIIEVDGGGIEVISTPIEPTLADIYQATANSFSANMAVASFAVAYRRAHRVLFFYPQNVLSVNLQGCGQWLVFDTRTRAWTAGYFSTQDANGFRDQKTCGVVRWTDDRLILANWNNASTDAYLFLERQAYSTADYRDTDFSGTDRGIQSYIGFQYQQPDATGAVHWQRVTAIFEASEFANRPLAASASFQFTTDGVSATINATPSVFDTTVEVPSAVRRGKRCLVIVSNTAADEYLGLLGLEFMLADEAPTRARRA